MNSRKKVAYRIFLFLCGLAMVVGTVLVACSAIEIAETDFSYLWAFGGAIATLFLLPLNALAHETGHLVFGALAGLRFSSLRVSRLRIFRVGKRFRMRFMHAREVAGSCEMYPGNAKGVRGKMIFYSLGGATFNLVYGLTFLTLFLLCESHPALYFFAIFAPLNLFEAAASLYPAETATGMTDGGLVAGLVRNRPSAVVSLRVLTAQGILSLGSFSEVGEELLFDTPVVREDDPAFLALLQLRYYYLFYYGREEEALAQLLRLETLFADLPEVNRADVACDLLYAYSVLRPDELRAQSYLEAAAHAVGTCAYLRAMAAYVRMKGEEGDFLDRAKRAAQEEPIVGMAELERKFLERLER
ncbi:MAG: hypothetical protein ACI4NG_04455 [Candidatus Gallimonas sp.]